MKPAENDFKKAMERALKLANRAAGRTDSKSLRDLKEATALYRGLVHRLRGRSPMERWNVRRHYYRCTGQHLRTVALGHAEIARGNRSGVLSIGFGHLDYAGEQWAKGRYKTAMSHAAKAEKAFRRILRLEGPKSNRCLALGLSLAMQGKFEAAEQAAGDAQRCGCTAAEMKQWKREIKKLRRDSE